MVGLVHPVRQSRQVLEEEGIEVVGLRARGVAGQNIGECESLQITKPALDTADGVFGEVRQCFVEPGRLEVGDRTILKALAGIDHVLELVRDRAAGALSHRAG